MLLVLKLADIAPILRRMNLIFKLNGPCLFHCGCVFFLFWLRVFVFLFFVWGGWFLLFFWCWFSPFFASFDESMLEYFTRVAVMFQ